MSETVIPKGSLVLITGATGCVGGEIANQVLKAGYKVRAVVRNAEKAQYITEAFHERYGKEAFHTVLIEDMGKPGCFDEAMKGCSGVVHVASDVSFGADPNVVIPPVLKLADNLLHAAAKVPSVKRFVYTSSTSALADESGTGHLHLTTESWNEESLTAAYKEPFTPENALHVYSASKVLGERACFDFVKENKPGFVVNSVVPNFNIGPVIHPKLLSSTNMIVAGTFNSDPTALGYAHMILPQFSISLEDDGLLHLAGLTMEDVKNERLIAAADSFTFNDMLDIMAKFDPSKKLPERQPKNEQAKRTIDTSRSVEILKRFGKTGFTSVEESILQCLSTMPKA